MDFVGRIKFIKYWVEHKGVVGTWERVYVMSIENIISIYFLMKKNHIKLNYRNGKLQPTAMVTQRCEKNNFWSIILILVALAVDT